jgi:hypothetical protein
MTAVVTRIEPRTTAAPTPPDTEQAHRGDKAFVVTAIVVYLLLRVPASLWPLKPDESGFLLVARAWHPTTDNMYGFLWVDRPPILIGLYRFSDLIAGPYAPRAAGALLWVGMIVAVYRAGFLIGGRVAARWATVVTVALATQPALETWSAKSEALGAPLVAVSCWLTLEAVHRRPGPLRLVAAFAAGLSGALAVGMKQNLGGAVVFGAIVLVLALRTRRTTLQEGGSIAAAAGLGFGVVLAAVLAWAAMAGIKLRVLWDMLYGFRSEGFSVILSQDTSAPLDRADQLLLLAVTSGMAIILLWFAVSFPTLRRRHPVVAPAVAAMVGVDVVSLVLGGSYWSTYLTPLIPDLALAVGLLASIGFRRLVVTRGVAVVAAVSAALSLVIVSTDRLDGSEAPSDWYSGEAIGEVAHRDDSIMVLYGRADIVQASDLRPAYAYLWSLPMRVLDPELVRVRALVASNAGPTWIVQEGNLNWLGLDPLGRLGAVLFRNYRIVGTACEYAIWLRKGTHRPPLPDVDCDRPWHPFV